MGHYPCCRHTVRLSISTNDFRRCVSRTMTILTGHYPCCRHTVRRNISTNDFRRCVSRTVAILTDHCPCCRHTVSPSISTNDFRKCCGRQSFTLYVNTPVLVMKMRRFLTLLIELSNIRACNTKPYFGLGIVFFKEYLTSV